MKSASGRSCSKLAKAASISRLVPTLRTRICNPIACAPACTSCNVLSVLVAWAGLTSTASRFAAGTISRSSSSRFAANSVNRKLIPVKLPPQLHRVLRHAEDDWDRRGRLLRSECSGRRCGYNHGHTLANQIGRKLRQSIELPVSPAKFERNVLAFDVSGLLEALAKSAQILREGFKRCGVENPNYWHRRLLRPRRERPCGSRAAK